MASITIRADQEKSLHAIAASFDMVDFSACCLHPNAAEYLNQYLAVLFDRLDQAFKNALRAFVSGTKGIMQVRSPDFIKYTGDGAIMLWICAEDTHFPQDFCDSVILALREFQQELPHQIEVWEKKHRVSGFPHFARIGISAGPIKPLFAGNGMYFGNPFDYAGYCINLAVRLQDHCPPVGFLIHEHLKPTIPGLKLLKAKGMKGSAEEPVYVFEDDFIEYKDHNKKEARLKFTE